MNSSTKNRAPFLQVILLFCLTTSLLLIAPYLQFGRALPHAENDSGELLPHPLSGLAARGSHIYAENGCASCHTQQTRNHPIDSSQAYGKRASVARDFLYQPATIAGTIRIGPDLSNLASRNKTAQWHHQHLFLPSSLSPGTIMPSYDFLYEKRKIVGQPSQNALKLPSNISIEEGYEIIPTAEAEALVAYLLSLDQNYPLPEAPIKEE